MVAANLSSVAFTYNSKQCDVPEDGNLNFYKIQLLRTLNIFSLLLQRPFVLDQLWAIVAKL
jgi:hypothetical protein